MRTTEYNCDKCGEKYDWKLGFTLKLSANLYDKSQNYDLCVGCRTKLGNILKGSEGKI